MNKLGCALWWRMNRLLEYEGIEFGWSDCCAQGFNGCACKNQRYTWRQAHSL